MEGNLTWNYQKDSAKITVQRIEGIKGITNKITLIPLSKDAVEKQSIEEALERNWAINRKNIHIEVSGNTVKLTGRVGSYYKKKKQIK